MGSSPKLSRRSGACGWFEQRRTEFLPWTELNSGFASDSASGHRNPANQYRDSTRRDRDPADDSRANHPRLHFAQWNSKHNHPRHLTEHLNPGKPHAAVAEYSWHFAERFALWNLARHGRRSVGVRTECGILKLKSLDSRKSGQQHVAGHEPDSGHPLPASCRR